MSTPENYRLNFSYFVNPHEEGENVSAWPQHLTVVPPVLAADPRVGPIAVTRTVENAYSFPVTLDKKGKLGGHGVWFFDQRSEGLAAELHKRLLENLTSQGIESEDIAGSDDEYIPHITYDRKLFGKKEPELYAGQVLLVDHIALVLAPPFKNGHPTGLQRIDKIFKLKPRL